MCDFRRLAENVLTIVGDAAHNKALFLKLDAPDEIPWVKVDSQRISQILFNLIGNAVKFTDRGEVAWSASATPNADGSVVLALDVRDTGIGIAPDKRETVFDPFVQDISTRGGRIYEGTGLGLPIVKRLVSSCGGTVDLDGVPGGGSLFRVRLPRIEVADDGPAAPVPEAPASEKGHDPASVLLADDVPLNLRILSLHLKAIGFQNIRTASSGNAALAALREQPADLVLTDLWMPDGNGAELARAMRADPVLSRIPIVAVTADVNASPLFDTTLFHTILTKPVTTEKLAALLSTLFPKKA
jgi:CheY-like chemotaxis protein/anti-sigma regulatory factor (Ser/Thr protein kinase)